MGTEDGDPQRNTAVVESLRIQNKAGGAAGAELVAGFGNSD